MNKKKLKFLTKLVVILVIIVLLAIGAIVYAKIKIDEYKATITECREEMEMNTSLVYVATQDIAVGDIITDGENVEMQTIYSGIDNELYMTDEQLGSIAKVNINFGSPIYTSMITSLNIDQDTREYEITVVDLMVDQHTNDFIDIRIMFPNGEDYLVLPKKEIKNLLLDSAVFYSYLNEEEILRLASATIDAYTITGTKIYATRYIESNLQEAAKANYLVKSETLDLLSSDPNLLTMAQETMNLQARMSLETRLGNLTEDQLTAVAEGHGIQDTAKAQVLVNLQNNNIYDEESDTYTSDSNDEYIDQLQNEISSSNEEPTVEETP